MDNFIKSEYTIEDLEQFRDVDGFIDLSKAGIQFTKGSREEVGNPNRVKNWVDFMGTRALLKGETILDTEKNYGIYAELIVEEMASQLGMKTAHYDLMKITDEQGNLVFGVLSESIVDIEREYLVTLRDIIGDESEADSDYLDTTRYEYTIDRLRETLLSEGYEEADIEKLLEDYKKRQVFSILISEEDMHTENVAFIRKKENGKDKIDLSPKYDSESSLLLDYEISSIEKMLENGDIKARVDCAHPRIGVYRTVEEGGLGSYWKDTLEALCEEDEIYDYYAEIAYETTLDMNYVFENVEKRIKAPLPKSAKEIAALAYQYRREAVVRLMGGEIAEELDFSSAIRKLSEKFGVTLGEIEEVEEALQTDKAKYGNVKDKSYEEKE